MIMPLDGTREIAVLDGVAELLRDPADWCQRTIQDGRALCLLGALTKVATGSVDQRLPGAGPGQRAANRVAELSGRFVDTAREEEWAICAFNNNSTHEEVLGLVARARASFVTEAAHAV
jgi:hypothetical protein